MLQELISTRCRYGVDILKDGNAHKGDGYNIYSCSPSVYQDPNACPVGLLFLLRIMETKPLFKDPDFMQDAYYYLKPDGMNGMLMDSTPIPFDPNKNDDYSNRSGNFINQMLIGDFSAIYPYETFGDSMIWDAKGRGESYYYHTPPQQNAGRPDITSASGRYGIDDIRSFIRDGRQDALKKAVAFLISQYDDALPKEQRRYLIIQDDSTEHLELWIAAIESAFSPKMASGLPFATRMSEAVSANRYTVDERGVFQSAINLQDPRQKTRYRAMVVGVDTRLSGAALSPQGQPYVVLDGRTKQAKFDADTQHPYYSFITRLDDNQTYFCREFLQTFGIDQPSKMILPLYESYRKLFDSRNATAGDMTAFFNLIRNVPTSRTRTLTQIYRLASEKIDGFFSQDPVKAMTVLDWLIRNCSLADDPAAKPRLKQKLFFAFGEALFRHGSGIDVASFWQEIKNAGYTSDIAKYLMDEVVIENYKNDFRQFTATEAIALFTVQTECSEALAHQRLGVLKFICMICILVFARGDQMNMLKQMAERLKKATPMNVEEFLRNAAKSSNRKIREFVTSYLVAYDDSIIASETAVENCCVWLRSLGMEGKTRQLADRFVKAHGGIRELNRAARYFGCSGGIARQDLAALLTEIDHAVWSVRNDPDHRMVCELATFLQQQYQKTNTVMPVSAHLCAMEALNTQKRTVRIQDLIGNYVHQGFPHVSDASTVKTICEKLLRPAFEGKENDEYIADLLLIRNEAYLVEYFRQLLGAEEHISRRQQTSERLLNTIRYYNAQERNAYNFALQALTAALRSTPISNRTAERMRGTPGEVGEFFTQAYNAAFPKEDRGGFWKLFGK